jgi:hypothetical protein
MLRVLKPEPDATIARWKRDQHARLRAGTEEQMGCDGSLLVEGVEDTTFLDLESQRLRCRGVHGSVCHCAQCGKEEGER